jgi:hypothetical protein
VKLRDGRMFDREIEVWLPKKKVSAPSVRCARARSGPVLRHTRPAPREIEVWLPKKKVSAPSVRCARACS